MKPHSTTLFLAGLILLQSFVVGAPAITRRQSESPCASLNEQVTAFTQRNLTARLDAQEAYDCLRTIPFDSNRGATFVQEVRKHVQWQASIDTLTDPPSASAATFGHVDLLHGLSDIEEKARTDKYSAQVDFDTELRNLLNSAYDGHLGISGLCTDSIFSFESNAILVSIAGSSTSPPEVYDFDSLQSSNDSTTPSPITTIGGRDAVDFLVDYTSLINLRDVDARYNALFASNARHGGTAKLRGLFGSKNTLWTGYPSLNYTYANGTQSSWHMTAYLNSRQTRWNYTSGEELFSAFCAVTSQTSSSSNSTAPSNSTNSTGASTAPTQTAFPEAYPEPVIRDPFNALAGFYVESASNDTAVLFVPDFETSGEDVYTGLDLPESENADFAQAASDFISRAKSDNKTRLIIDLSGNGGGTTLQGFNLFKLLFPTTPIFMANRYRNHNFSRLLMKALDTYTEDYDDEFTYSLPRHFAWAGQVSPDQSSLNWTSYLNFTGPQSDNLTALTSFNNFTAISTPDLPVQGYSNISTTFTSPPFLPENILIITDGFCASTCSIFVELMTALGGIDNTLVFGGRPPSVGNAVAPMELVGGTRGTEAYSWSILADNAAETLEYVEMRLNESKPTLSQDEIAQYKELMPIAPSKFPLQFQSGSVNLRNGYANGSSVALEFESQQAKCRLYYTKENILKPATAWQDAIDAIWGGKGCAAVSDDSGDGRG